MKTQIKEVKRYVVTLSVTQAEYDYLIDKLGKNDKHSYLICFNSVSRVGSAFKAKLNAVKVKGDTRALGITDTIAEMGVSELFTLEYKDSGVCAHYSTLDGRFNHHTAILKIVEGK